MKRPRDKPELAACYDGTLNRKFTKGQDLMKDAMQDELRFFLPRDVVQEIMRYIPYHTMEFTF